MGILYKKDSYTCKNDYHLQHRPLLFILPESALKTLYTDFQKDITDDNSVKYRDDILEKTTSLIQKHAYNYYNKNIDTHLSQFKKEKNRVYKEETSKETNKRVNCTKDSAKKLFFLSCIMEQMISFIHYSHPKLFSAGTKVKIIVKTTDLTKTIHNISLTESDASLNPSMHRRLYDYLWLFEFTGYLVKISTSALQVNYLIIQPQPQTESESEEDNTQHRHTSSETTTDVFQDLPQ